MPYELRRPNKVNLDRFIRSLDQRLRDEVPMTRRTRLPRSITKLVRAVRIRAMALLQGGAMALTALAVIIAVGIAPHAGTGDAGVSGGSLAAPMVHTDSLLLTKLDPSSIVVAVGDSKPAPFTRGIVE